MTKLWVVWETEYPESGCVAVEGEFAEDALSAYVNGGFKDGTAALSIYPLTLSLPKTAIEGANVEELAKVLKAGYRAILREADDWRPLANHVLQLMALARHEGTVSDASFVVENEAKMTAIHERDAARAKVAKLETELKELRDADQKHIRFQDKQHLRFLISQDALRLWRKFPHTALIHCVECGEHAMQCIEATEKALRPVEP